MNKVNTFTLDGQDIEMLFQNDFLAYSLEFKGKTYGQKVKLKSKSVEDISSATFLLIENAISTLKELNK